ncbi:MAG: translation elongation factor Ts, partial [Verrucomicrobia bacterium]|nr:translation elongation factor Ts [Verrucomicrobiota bacterium]
MTAITATLVKQLRDATNVSMMECKRALVDADGDVNKAGVLLRERGVAVAAKKADRVANQGLIATATSDAGNTIALVEVNCETDFVARNENFVAFVSALAEQACNTDGDLATVVREDITSKIAEIGENIIARRNTRYVRKNPG